jgi:hypothetical protein
LSLQLSLIQSFCAVLALKQLFTLHPLPACSPLFAGSDGKPLTHSFFISKLQSQLSTAGVDPSSYSSHSFCRGAAMSVAAAGYSDYEIQLLGQQRSDAYKLYLDVPIDCILHLSACLHVATAQAQPPEPPALHFTPGFMA